MDPLYWVTRAPLPFLSRCHVPWRLEDLTSVGEEVSPCDSGVSRKAVDRVWTAVENLYHTGAHPAIQVCIRRHGHVVLNRAIGHASGNAPADPPEAPKVLVTPDTPFNLFSASKAITAMVIHKLDEKRVLHLEDRVCDFIPEFASHGKHRITIRHILSHRAGIPNLPPEAIDLVLSHPDRIVEMLCDARLQSRPGRVLAYHAVSGGFVLAELVRRATGQDIRTVLEREIQQPLGFRWMNYGVRPEDVDRVARNAFTGPPVPPPVKQLLGRALGTDLNSVVDLSNDPRFLTGVIPSANVMANAFEASAFYQCLLDEGELDGVRVFTPSTVRHATSEQSYWELDFTLILPLRYGLGFMLGDRPVSLFGWDTPQAFGHLGLSNIFTWADPERRLAAAILTSGKPAVSLHAIRLFQLIKEIGHAFPKVEAGPVRRTGSAPSRARAAR